MPKSKEEVPAEKGMTKAAAVREAIKAGMDKPANAVAYIKEKFDLDVTAQQFSIYKSADKKKSGGGDPKVAKPRKVKATNRDARPFIQFDTHVSELGLAKGVKELVKVYGAAAVKEMVEVFAD